MDCTQYKLFYAEFSKRLLPREIFDSIEWSDWMKHFHECCPEHSDPADCPDILISYFARFDEYFIAVRGGGPSRIAIRYCSWCGVALPKSKRSRWLDELTALGYTDSHGDDLHSDDIPPEFWTDAWYKKAK